MQQVRARVLRTANKTGVYADQDTYGQGLLDLAAAAAPVGLTYVPLSTNVGGQVVRTQASTINVPERLRSSLSDAKVLVVDGYQRAPFVRDLLSFVSLRRDSSQFDPSHLFEAFAAQGVSTPMALPRNSRSAWAWQWGAKENRRSDRWAMYAGYGQHSGLVQALDFPLGLQLPTDKAVLAMRYAWPSATGDANWTWAAWSPIGKTTLQAERTSFLVDRNQALASMQTGWALQKHLQVGSDHRMQWGLVFGRSTGVSDVWTGTGAFETASAQSWTTTWGGQSLVNKTERGQWDVSYGVHHTRLRESNTAGLWSVEEPLQLLDAHARLRYINTQRNTSWSLSWGQTKSLGNNTAQLRLPQAVNEEGEVRFANLDISLKPLYAQTRWSLSMHHAFTADLSMVGVFSHVDPVEGRSERLVGAGMRWAF
jgi:hypothetical protein